MGNQGRGSSSTAESAANLVEATSRTLEDGVVSELDVSQYSGLSTPHFLGQGEAVARFSRNEVGRDFVVGDVHGMFSHLDALLAEIDFKPSQDRLFSVGDLVDRGPDSHAAAEWVELPWFHACRGNHEQFVLDSSQPDQLDLWINHNGGEWWLDLSDEQHEMIRCTLARLPLAIELETKTGMVGIVHADIPPLVTWERFMSLLGNGNADALFYALWSRLRVSGGFDWPVEGEVDRIYCGHTPTQHVVRVGNVYFIDTGAVYGVEGYSDARLTVIEVHPERHVEHAIGTHGPPPMLPPSNRDGGN